LDGGEIIIGKALKYEKGGEGALPLQLLWWCRPCLSPPQTFWKCISMKVLDD